MCIRCPKAGEKPCCSPPSGSKCQLSSHTKNLPRESSCSPRLIFIPQVVPDPRHQHLVQQHRTGWARIAPCLLRLPKSRREGGPRRDRHNPSTAQAGPRSGCLLVATRSGRVGNWFVGFPHFLQTSHRVLRTLVMNGPEFRETLSAPAHSHLCEKVAVLRRSRADAGD